MPNIQPEERGLTWPEPLSSALTLRASRKIWSSTYPKAGTYTVTLTNKSETAVSANLVIDYSGIGNLINKIESKTWTGENALALDCTLDTSATKATTGSLALGPKGSATATKTVKLTLTFVAVNDPGADMDAILAITEPMTGLSGETEKIPFDVFAVFTQID